MTLVSLRPYHHHYHHRLTLPAVVVVENPRRSVPVSQIPSFYPNIKELFCPTLKNPKRRL
ncbi:hypothetical protein HanXRQr2_Chr16g0741141 [Helianthus annuus]|uniref:Uncharacterized protein n=1 Tax=Helianthus annuus TaxID=4232 RepID=A0A251UVG4_HELAN|nr:hypothetical protein HanXRQr2_Chr16g0741141 [Helianthus annuus]